MIYLIDDKKQRQLGYGWNEMRIEKFNPFLKPIHSYEQILNNNIQEEIFSPGSIVLFHESFFDAESNRHAKNSMTIRIELEKYAKKTENFKLVFFSGSKNSRYHDRNIAHLPVSQLYINLENFIVNYSKGDGDLRYLLYGSNHLIEEYLIKSYTKANNEIDQLLDYDSESINLYIRPFQNFIQKPLLKFDEQTIFNKVTDDDLNDLVVKWLNHKTYQNIFIPLCFGPVLSDFNGLRLALHIRTTSTLSQFANIYIYGTVDHSNLVQNDYYDILKTKNVRLIDYKRSSFRDALFLNFSDLNIDNLSVELDKIKLNPPKNYHDNHSIANEWSIVRWFKTIQKSEVIDYTPDEIESIESKINSNLYYKYLTCKFPVNNLQGLSVEDLKLKFNGKILYIDDEKDKGWNELFCALFYDDIINKVEDYESFGSEFNELEKDEIIKLSVNKAKDFDLVILDFRLTEKDFYETDPKKITGYKILEGIKTHNKGIQVVIFSATNKVWNLQALLDAGADGFIIKESPENSLDSSFTAESLKNVTTIIDNCLERKYLKQIEIFKISIEKLFSSNPLSKYYPNDLRILRGIQYQNLLLTELTAISDILSSKNENRFNHAMLMQFKIIECIIEIFIPEKINGKWIFWDKTEMQYFYVEDSKLYKSNAELCFYDSNIKRKKVMKIPPYEYNSSRNKIDCLIEQKIDIDNKNDIHKQLKKIIDYRNSFIHPKDRLALKMLSSSEILKWMELIDKIITKI